MIEAQLEYVGPPGNLVKRVGAYKDGIHGRLYAYAQPETTVQSTIEQWREDYKPVGDFKAWNDHLTGVDIREAIHRLLTPQGWVERCEPVDFPRHFMADPSVYNDGRDCEVVAVLLLIRKRDLTTP